MKWTSTSLSYYNYFESTNSMNLAPILIWQESHWQLEMTSKHFNLKWLNWSLSAWVNPLYFYSWEQVYLYLNWPSYKSCKSHTGIAHVNLSPGKVPGLGHYSDLEQLFQIREKFLLLFLGEFIWGPENLLLLFFFFKCCFLLKYKICAKIYWEF